MQALAEMEPLKSFTLAEVMDVPPDKIEEVEAKLLKHPAVKVAKDYRVDHHFSDGVYVRQIYMPEGDLILGCRHRTKHLNCIHAGKAAVMMDGVMQIIKAPMIFESCAGVRKVLYILEGPMIWSTVHVTPERDLLKLEEALIDKTVALKEYESDMKQLEAFTESAGGL